MLLDKINTSIIESLKSGDNVKVSTLRFLVAAIKNAEIELHSQGKMLDDAAIISVIAKQVKQHKESIEAYTEAGRPELAAKEQAELEILQAYLPVQMGEGEVRRIVSEAIKLPGSNDMGSVMKVVMSQLKGKADGGMVRRVVEEELGK